MSDSALPRTSGLVTLFTTRGIIAISLFTSLAKTTCRNFLQHCVNGFYNGLSFHRVLPGILIQTGLPPGTSPDGGKSAIVTGGRAFRGETSSRLNFRLRGIVAMAGDVDDCRSQFFITLDSCRWMDGKHCVFGVVKSESIGSVTSIGRCMVEGETPVNPVIIEKVHVTDNPFDDILPTVQIQPKRPLNSTAIDGTRRKKRTKLSFDEEDDDADENLRQDLKQTGRGTASQAEGLVSSHDVLDDPLLLRMEGPSHGVSKDEESPGLKAQFDRDTTRRVGREGEKDGDEAENRTKRESSGDKPSHNLSARMKPNSYRARQMTKSSALGIPRATCPREKQRPLGEEEILELLKKFRRDLKDKSTKKSLRTAFEPLVFEKSAEESRNRNDYVMIDPLQNMRGRLGEQLKEGQK